MITARQKEARKSGIGSSDAAAIMGLDPYRTAHDVWLEKTGRVDGFEAGEKAELGNALERGLLKLVGRRINDTVRAPRWSFVRGRMRANIDGMVGEPQKGAPIVEVKTTGLVDGWGPDNSAEIPDRVLVQVHHQMWCAESDRGFVACLRAFRGLELTIHPVRIDPDLSTRIVESCERFWKDNVLRDKPPEGSVGSLDTLAKVKRNGASIKLAEPTMQVVRRYVEAREVMSKWERECEDLKAAIITALGDAEHADAGDFTVSYKASESNRINTDRLRREHPDIAATVTMPVMTRRFECKAVRR
jgi:putative phage-type endonuclease